MTSNIQCLKEPHFFVWVSAPFGSVVFVVSFDTELKAKNPERHVR